MSRLAFLYVIFWTFLEGKLGHTLLEGKLGQPVQNLLQVTLIHGSKDALHDLARSDLQKHYIVHIPSVGEIIEYGVFPKFVTPSTQIALSHEKEIQLEIISEHDGAWIRVPQNVVEEDPRWQTLGQMGAVRAKWHNNGLMLMPVTAKTIALEKAKAGLTDCCAKCKFLKAGFCNHEDSPMYQLSVDPNGVCPNFIINNNSNKNEY